MDTKSPKDTLDPSKVTAQAAHKPTGPNIQTRDVLSEIEKVKKEINDILEKAPKDDPAYTANVKKLVEIKAYLERKTDSGRPNWINKIRRRKRNVNFSSSYAEEDKLMDPTTSSEFSFEEFEQHEHPQDLANINLDDSILYGIESAICAYHFIKSIVDFIK